MTSRAGPPPPPAPSIPTRTVTVPAAALHRGRGSAPVHTAHWPADGDAPVAVLVHGLGGSHVNWSLLGPRLRAAGWAVWAPDLAGFGLTGLGGRSAAIDDQLDLLEGFVATVAGDEPVRLVGNSMGGLLALRLAARAPERVTGLVLSAPSTPPAGRPDGQVVTRFALSTVPGLAPWWVRRQARAQSAAVETAQLLQLCAADPTAIDRGVLSAHAALVARRRLLGTPERAVPVATRTLLRRLGPERARVWAAVDAVAAPTLLVGGDADRLVSPATLDRLADRRPDWTRVRLTGVGHVPMLEVPDRLASLAASPLPQAAR